MPLRLLPILLVLGLPALAAQSVDEDFFKIQPFDEIVLKDGAAIRGEILESDDPGILRFKQLPARAIRSMPRSDVRSIQRRTTPDTIVDKIVEKYGSNPPILAEYLAYALDKFRGIETKALRALEDAAKTNHKDVLLLLGKQYLKSGRAADAESAARKVIDRTGAGEGHLLLGRALGALGQHAAALEALERAREKLPNNEEIQVALAEIQLQAGKGGDAEKVFRDTLASNPNSSGALIGLGYVLLKQGQFADAETQFAKAKDLAPRSAKARLGLAACQIMKKDFSSAHTLLDEVLQIDTASAQAYGLKAYAMLMGGDHTQLPKALEKLNEALKEDPNDARFKVIKAVMLDRMAYVDEVGQNGSEAQNKRAEATRLMAEVEAAKPADAWLAYLMAEFRFLQGDFEAALEGFTRAAELDPGYAPAHRARGAAALRTRKWQEAADAYQSALKRDETQAGYYAGLGLAYLGMKKFLEAQAQFKRALDLDPKNVEALTGLGFIKNAEKDEVNARKLFREALAADGSCAYAAKALNEMLAQRDYRLDYFNFDGNSPAANWAAKGGRQVKATVSDNAIRWAGTQGSADSSDMEYHVAMTAEEFSRLEADLSIDKNSPATLTVRLASRTGSAATWFVEFGKGDSGHFAYRFRDFSGRPPHWNLLTNSDPWPDSGKARIAIETPDLKRGEFTLFVNGEEKGTLPLKLTAPRKITAGVSCSVAAKEAVDARADNIALVRRKQDEAAGEPGGGLIAPEKKEGE